MISKVKMQGGLHNLTLDYRTLIQQHYYIDKGTHWVYRRINSPQEIYFIADAIYTFAASIYTQDLYLNHILNWKLFPIIAVYKYETLG